MTRTLAVLAALALASPAGAQGLSCTDRATMAARLAAGWSETRQSVGLGADGALVETWANLTSGSWTVTVTTPSGVACIAASGEHFERLDEALPAEGEPA